MTTMTHSSRVLLTTSLAILSVFMQTAADQTVYSCFGQANKTLDINCGEGYMVHITRAFYGFSATGQCRLVEGEGDAGCIKDDRVTYDCVGRSRCSINLPTGQRGLEVPACRQRSNYFQVHYTCVKATTVHDICREDKLYEQSGYIKTPRYPLNYRQQGLCAISIVAHPSQTIRLTIIDLNLKDSGQTSCADSIYFNDKLSSITMCSHRSNDTKSWLTNSLHIELESTSGGLSKGFWLYYEAFPPLPNTLPTPAPQPVNDEAKVQTSSSELDESHGLASGSKKSNHDMTPAYHDLESTVPLIRNHRQHSNKLPFAAIAGGVIGTLSLILVILLLMLLVKWLNERKYYRAEKILEIRNPAFRSSGDFYEQQQQQANNNDYNYC